MKKTTIILILAIIVLTGFVIYARIGDNSQITYSKTTQQNQKTSLEPSSPSPTPTSEPTSSPTPTSDPNVKTYTVEEVRKHGPESWDNGDSSPLCWMVIHGKVYEIPDSFTETHPGGHVIYDGCGTDATELFETRPQGSGTPHSANARKLLEKFYIGDLKK